MKREIVDWYDESLSHIAKATKLAMEDYLGLRPWLYEWSCRRTNRLSLVSSCEIVFILKF